MMKPVWYATEQENAEAVTEQAGSVPSETEYAVIPATAIVVYASAVTVTESIDKTNNL